MYTYTYCKVDFNQLAKKQKKQFAPTNIYIYCLITMRHFVRDQRDNDAATQSFQLELCSDGKAAIK